MYYFPGIFLTEKQIRYLCFAASDKARLSRINARPPLVTSLSTFLSGFFHDCLVMNAVVIV